MDVDVLETLIPFFALLVVCVVLVSWMYLRHKARLATQKTYRLALERGSELSPEFIRHLGEPEPSRDRDLRRGLIWLALALGFAGLGIMIPDDEALGPMLGVASFPFFIGLAFIVMYRFGTKKES